MGKLVACLDKCIGMKLLRSQTFSMLCTDLLLLVSSCSESFSETVIFYGSVSPPVKMRMMMPLLESFKNFIKQMLGKEELFLFWIGFSL